MYYDDLQEPNQTQRLSLLWSTSADEPLARWMMRGCRRFSQTLPKPGKRTGMKSFWNSINDMGNVVWHAEYRSYIEEKPYRWTTNKLKECLSKLHSFTKSRNTTYHDVFI